MTPTELRIGNFVKLCDTGEIVRVGGLDYNFVMCGQKRGRCTKYYDEIEPVLIHEVKDKITFPRDLMWADKTMCEDLYYYRDVVITDLHELQNIHFALTGNEIEIEL